MTVYEVVGGEGFFVDLVGRFYALVAEDEVLMSMYPSDLSEPARKTAGFLAQYWGGPPHYSAERGHPRLRMRHAPFPIDSDARDRWLDHMLAALDATIASHAAPAEVAVMMTQYFEQASTAMINRAE